MLIPQIASAILALAVSAFMLAAGHSFIQRQAEKHDLMHLQNLMHLPQCGSYRLIPPCVFSPRSATFDGNPSSLGPLRVIRVGLAGPWRLPIYPRERTFSG